MTEPRTPPTQPSATGGASSSVRGRELIEPAPVERAVAGPVSPEAAVVDGVGFEPAVVDGVDVDAVAVAVRACGGVSGLFAGRYGEVGTYLPGRRVAGVEVRDRTVTVHVRSRWGVAAKRLLGEITAATAPLVAARTVHVVVADIDDPPGAGLQSAPAPTLAPSPASARPSPPAGSELSTGIPTAAEVRPASEVLLPASGPERQPPPTLPTPPPARVPPPPPPPPP